MPTPYIKKLAREGKGTVKELEQKWDDAKSKAKEAGHADDWPYVTSIFQSMVGASVANSFAKLKREGHGRIVARTDGSKAMCALCATCFGEMQMLQASGVEFNSEPLPDHSARFEAALVAPSGSDNTAMEEMHDPDPIRDVETGTGVGLPMSELQADEAGPFQGVASTAASRLLATHRGE